MTYLTISAKDLCDLSRFAPPFFSFRMAAILAKYFGPRLAVCFPPFAPEVAAGDSSSRLSGKMNGSGEKVIGAVRPLLREGCSSEEVMSLADHLTQRLIKVVSFRHSATDRTPATNFSGERKPGFMSLFFYSDNKRPFRMQLSPCTVDDAGHSGSWERKPLHHTG